ncbi:MAG: PQQ-dependent oxidoreductase, gdhB family, partial [Lacunisphaera sp.]|nr:PQQ-dependent oxidoreductase, gdhB family [Lacunisphaera sp.]
MRRLDRGTSRALVFALFTAGAHAHDGAPRIGEITRDGGVIYEQMCANCHGTGLGGGKGGSLLGGTLKHGDSDASLTKSIHDGFPATGMPAFGNSLSTVEIQAVVVHLRERFANYHAPQKTEPIDPHQTRNSELHSYRIETIVDEGLEVPWSFVFLPDGRILLTERAGRLRIIDQ